MSKPMIAALVAAALAPAVHAQTATAPGSSQSPYLLPMQPGTGTVAILTAGDGVSLTSDPSRRYRMAGIPDGLGAFDNHDGTFTVLMNHELGSSSGVVRAHGAKGAFVSKWIVNKDSLVVVSGEDLVREVYEYAAGAWTPVSSAAARTFNRFCSADLAPPSAFLDRASGRGATARIFLTGEESGAEGRAVAHVVTGPDAGRSYILASLGRFSWENAVAKPDSGAATVVAGLDDSGNGQVYFYVGAKTTDANPVTAAGLQGGRLYGLRIEAAAGQFLETNASVVPDGTPFSIVDLGDVSARSGAQLEAASNAALVSGLQRPEDGSWDPSDPRHFYFATTASFTGKSRLWQLTFADPADVTRGGTVRIVAESPAYDPARPNADQNGPRMLDNITVNSKGQVLAVEDVGSNDYVGGLWQIDPATGSTVRVAQHDFDRFVPGAPSFLTRDEEASGVIPLAGILGESWYLVDVQAHYATDGETVEGGQLLAVRVPPRKVAVRGN